MARSTAQPKRATNVSIRSDLIDQARALDINLSQEFETHLAEVIRRRLEAQWLRQNRAAIEAYNRFVEREGVWNETLRPW